MIQATSILKALKENGFRFFSGVPCSLLKELIKAAQADTQIKYVPAVRENVALGLASGAHISGVKSCILIQNSGVGNIINALTSFNLIYKVPVLIIISMRGYKYNDAPEHTIMGEKTTKFLEDLNIPYSTLSENFEEEIRLAATQIKEKSIPVVLLLTKDLIDEKA
jgi:phosphonopyruvate decarboxylase